MTGRTVPAAPDVQTDRAARLAAVADDATHLAHDVAMLARAIEPAPGGATIDSCDALSLLATVFRGEDAGGVRDLADTVTVCAVALARSAGVSWDAIAAVIGTRRQAAWEAYADRVRSLADR